MIDFFRDKFLKNSQESNVNIFFQSKNKGKQKICNCCGFVFYDDGNYWLEKRKENLSEQRIENKANDVLITRSSKITKDAQSKTIEYSDKSEMIELDLFDLNRTFKHISKIANGRAEIYLLECSKRVEGKNNLELNNRLILLDSSELKKAFGYLSAIANSGASVYLIKAYKRKSKAFEFIHNARKKIVFSIMNKLEHKY